MRLAVPAFGALVAEPLFLVADSAMVGHLGASSLAALGIASAVLQTVVGLMVFLAYGTTPAVARRLGAGDEAGAMRSGVEGVWLALGLGVALAVIGAFASPVVVAAFGAGEDVSAPATAYLAISMAGLPAMLVVYAATGLLRGLQDTRTPLAVAVAGFAANIALNAVFIYGLGLGVAGSALGTVVAQWGMVVVYLVMIVRHAGRVGARLLPTRGGVLGSAGAGGWLFLRTASLRVAFLLPVFVASRFGSAELAALQATMTVYSVLGFALDALAIAAQALIGKGLGAGDTAGVRVVLRRCLTWGVGGGAVLGVVIAATSPVLGYVFTTDAAVLGMLVPAFVILGLATPLGGFVFVLDGVLIGAGDARYLALTGILGLAMFAPLPLAVLAFAPHDAVGLAWLVASLAFGYLGARALTLGLRARGSRWMVVGGVRRATPALP